MKPNYWRLAFVALLTLEATYVSVVLMLVGLGGGFLALPYRQLLGFSSPAILIAGLLWIVSRAGAKADGIQKGFGGVLIHDAALRVSRIKDIGIWGIALDAENEKLAQWYGTKGFQAAKEQPKLMYGRLDRFLTPQK